MTHYSYHFSLGDSTCGPVGFCARVTAENKDQAVKLLQEALWENELGIRVNVGDKLEYLEVYFNPEIVTADDIDEYNDGQGNEVWTDEEKI